LLDLACGPGRVAIPMARHFANVLAVDVEPEMIATGEGEARRHGITNIAWRVGRAENLQLPSGSIELVTIGEAFHRLDRARILEYASICLQPRGSLATLGGEPVWRGEEAWKRALVKVVNRWTGQVLGDPNEALWGGPSDELRAAGFQVEEHEWAVEQVWTCDSVVGFMRSTSIASGKRLATVRIGSRRICAAHCSRVNRTSVSSASRDSVIRSAGRMDDDGCTAFARSL